jgi:hypothetical protein
VPFVQAVPKLFFPILILLACGCGFNDKIRIAENGVTRVHAQMDKEQFSDIYAEADHGLQASTKQYDFPDFLGAVHRKLGRVQTAEQLFYEIHDFGSTTVAELRHQV